MDMNLNTSGSDKPIKFHTQEPIKLIFIGHSVMGVKQGSKLIFNFIRGAEEAEVIHIETNIYWWEVRKQMPMKNTRMIRAIG